MTRAVVFLVAAMVAASLGVVAQDVSGGAPNSAQNNANNSAQRIVAVTGCLNSSAPGVYSLSDEHGTTYTLAGNTDTLRTHTAQQVEVTGQQELRSTSASTTSGTSTIHVTTTKLVADHCSASAGANEGASDSNVAQGAIDTAANDGQLPQTSTILPLLGLIGLGSLVAGFFARH